MAGRRTRSRTSPGPRPSATWMAFLLPLFLVAAPGSVTAQSTPQPRPVATMSELMVRILYPYSDAVFYITTRTPTNEEEWLELESRTLMLAESANLLMMAGRGWGGEERAEEWRRDAMLLLEAGEAAYEAAKARDVDGLAGLNDQLYQSCVRCHADFRPDYGRR